MSQKTCLVRDIPERFVFVSNSQDVEPILKNDVLISKKVLDFLMIRSVYVYQNNGEVLEVWCIQQEVPGLDLTAWKLK